MQQWYQFAVIALLRLRKSASQPQGNQSTITPYSDISSSSSDCDSEPNQTSSPTEHSTKKKRQRMTFSPIELVELELAFRRRPYLLKEDEEELVQRLGITAKSLKVSFYISFMFPIMYRKFQEIMSIYNLKGMKFQFGFVLIIFSVAGKY